MGASMDARFEITEMTDSGPWLVRVRHNKVSVGIFTCSEPQLFDLVDEVCEPDACEYKRLPAGGFVFGGEVVLHEIDPEADDFSEHMNGYLTESWIDETYEDDGDWQPVYFDLDD